MSKDDERVLCVPRSSLVELFGGELFQGYYESLLVRGRDGLHTLLQADAAMFVRRGDCENDRSLKQIIPYVMLTHHGYGVSQILRYNRAVKGEGEQRLAGKATIGIGGHINDVDHHGNYYDTFHAAWQREVREEVRIDSRYTARLRGLINDDSDEVGSVHLGVLIELQLDTPCVYPNEPNIIQPHFMPVGWYAETRATNFEGWSDIVLQLAFRKTGV